MHHHLTKFNSQSSYDGRLGLQYAVLNVPRNATESEIRQEKRNLVQTFHPNKYATSALRDKTTDGLIKSAKRMKCGEREQC